MLDTQLPWRAEKNEITGARNVVDAQDCEIAQVFGDTENNDERAQLIAAAPALLQAGAEALDIWDDCYSGTCYENSEDDKHEIATFEALREAIEAAGGPPTADINEPTPTGEVWLTTVIRKSWEPRMSWGSSEANVREDLLQYARDVAEIEDLADDASIADIADALGEQRNEQLYWERVQ